MKKIQFLLFFIVLNSSLMSMNGLPSAFTSTASAITGGCERGKRAAESMQSFAKMFKPVVKPSQSNVNQGTEEDDMAKDFSRLFSQGKNSEKDSQPSLKDRLAQCRVQNYMLQGQQARQSAIEWRRALCTTLSPLQKTS